MERAVSVGGEVVGVAVEAGVVGVGKASVSAGRPVGVAGSGPGAVSEATGMQALVRTNRARKMNR